MIEYAKQNNLKSICITDHFWDENVACKDRSFYIGQDFAHISQSLPLPQVDGIEFLFGAEGDVDRDFILGVSKECLEKFDFFVIATTHFHMGVFSAPEEYLTSPEKRAEAWVKKLDYVLSLDLPFHKIGIAHLACTGVAPDHDTWIATLDAIPEAELVRVFKKCAELGVGIEINAGDMNYNVADEDSILRIFRVAKAQGCKFYLGSDCHRPKNFPIAQRALKNAIDKLDLKESDKFILKR